MALSESRPITRYSCNKRSQPAEFDRSIDQTTPTMAVSPSTHLLTTPNEHPVATRHLCNWAEAAGAANEAVQPREIAAELVCFSGIENNDPRPTIPPPKPTL
jgi:hypothetical protein